MPLGAGILRLVLECRTIEKKNEIWNWWIQGDEKTSLVYVFLGKDEVWWTQVLVDPWFSADEVAPFEFVFQIQILMSSS